MIRKRKKMTTQKFNVGNLTAVYKKPNLTFVSLEEVDNANECRLYFEILLSIALMFFGTVLINFVWSYFIFGFVSFGVSIFFLIRYIIKNKSMREKVK